MNENKMFSAKMRCTGGRITRTFGGWLRDCERQDQWHERTRKERMPTLKNVRNFLRDYTDFRQD